MQFEAVKCLTFTPRCQEVLCYAVCWTESKELNTKLNFDVSPPEQTGQIKQTKMCFDRVKSSAGHNSAALLLILNVCGRVNCATFCIQFVLNEEHSFIQKCYVIFFIIK